jgi:hypothetical protein
MKKVHLTLQGKGGVGKSFAASLLVQYLQEKDQPVIAIDTDPVNATLSGYRSFSARRLELMDGSRLNERQFDEMMEWIVAEDSHFVIDNGASSFIPLSNYLIENSAIDLIAGAGKQVVIHSVVTGGQALLDTLAGFSQLARQLPENAPIVVWLNEYFGAIEANGKHFEEMKAYTMHKDRVTGIVRIARQTSDTFGKDVELMLDQKLTFADVAQRADFGLMAKQRLTMVKRALFLQLANVL